MQHFILQNLILLLTFCFIVTIIVTNTGDDDHVLNKICS